MNLVKPKNKKKKVTMFGYEVEQKKSVDENGFLTYVKGLLSSIYGAVSGISLPESRVHLKYLRGFKRVIAALFFLFYLVAGLMGLSNPISIMFLGTAYLLLDYLWKSRKITWWIKEKIEVTQGVKT